MLPLLTFASGIVAGIVGVKLLKNAKTPQSLHDLGDKARGGLDKAGAGLRDVTVSGLSAIEKSTAGLRARLVPAEAETEVVAEPAPKPKKPIGIRDMTYNQLHSTLKRAGSRI